MQLLYLMLPIYFANMAPPFVRYWRGWNRAISQRQLGSHKTVVGFSLGVVTAVAVVFAQSRIGWDGSLVDYDQWLALGVATGTGAMLGDSAKSLFKRRLKIAPGKPWIPFDQLDFVAGGLLALTPWIRLNILDVAAILALSFLGDICVNHVSFYSGIRDTKW
jgi:CDP-2,3-bis-(O-geranylgeranyl)-sn-glycerol synthase